MWRKPSQTGNMDKVSYFSNDIEKIENFYIVHLGYIDESQN